jgi:hypothetical protein
MENNTTKNKTEYVDSEYGFKYTKNEDGTITVTMDEINRFLSKEPIMMYGEYPSRDDENYMEGIWVDFETLIRNVGFTKQDMFGDTYQVSYEEVSRILLRLYLENGWDMDGKYYTRKQ